MRQPPTALGSRGLAVAAARGHCAAVETRSTEESIAPGAALFSACALTCPPCCRASTLASDRTADRAVSTEERSW
jgi:hypothetical protein